MPLATTTRRLLSSSFVDLLLGPYGVDRYLEQIRPDLTVRAARARVAGIERQTARSVTLTLRPNAAFAGFRAGQFIRVGVDIDGVRRTRTYSPASSEHRDDGLLELTVTAHPDGLVSEHLHRRLSPGTVLHLGPAQGEFVLPERRPDRLLLLSGGSGITPVLSILRTLCDEGHDGELTFVHFARTEEDWLYRPLVTSLANRHPNLRMRYIATQEGGPRLGPELIGELLAGEAPSSIHAAVCGPPALLEAARELWADAPERLLAETFAPPTLRLAGAVASGTLRFERSGREAAIATGTLLEQAEAAGLTPEFGCRMGICHTCTCRKLAGPVRNLRTGEVSTEEDEDIQLCISAPAGDVALDL
ncbi:MAG TPA: ferredoxin reductase [Solirubrobacteraceae bacterium]|nr:ferredoxin reductase [Solirubrobacteraceae bacterium]